MAPWLGHRRVALVLLSLVPGCIPKVDPSTGPSGTAAGQVAGAAPASPGRNVPAIKVDTVGYPTTWTKVAIFNVDPAGAVVSDEAGKVVLAVAPEKVRRFGLDPASQDPTWIVDFSALTTPGRYTLSVAGARSDPFAVAADVYRTALIAAQKMFFFQRTRMPLEAKYATWEGDTFVRAGTSHSHEDVGWLIEDYPEKKAKWPVVAGWHDAGNYDMYVPSTAPSAHGLLIAYETRPAVFRDGDLGIPESGNGIPDLLDEARWGIAWVLSMQEPAGGFRLREATARLGETGTVPADQDKTVRWIDRVGSASTAKGVALSAIAARVYARWNPVLAKLAEDAARRGWAWLEAHPERVMVPATMPSAVDNAWQLWDDGPMVPSDVGARVVAAAEMWRSFRLEAALHSLRSLLEKGETAAAKIPDGGWSNLSRWAFATLAFDAEAPSDLRDEARRRVLAGADAMRRQVEQEDGYLCATKPSDYYWGSNSNLLEKAHTFLVAARLDPEGHRWALQAARHQWHWILGRNPNGFSMVTRVGKGPTALYHMEWGPKYPKVPPGYLVGGPNFHDLESLAPGAPAKALLWETPRDLPGGATRGGLWHWAQSDLWEGGFLPRDTWDKGWWCVSEPDIYYNANLVLVGTEMAP